jgi:hypothetical protein
VAKLPGFAQAKSGRHQFLDLAGDGRQDCVVLERPDPGFYKRTADADWENFIALRSIPNVDWNDPNLRFIDLNGDGHADVLVTEHDVLTWYPSLAEAGFDAAFRVAKALDEETGPAIVFADGSQTIFVADMSGDGLSDLVRIRNGAVCYWPNLGYGQFGAKVEMENAPWFEAPDLFDPKRVRLADIDGSGVANILYLAPDGVRLYFNQAGNAWSGTQALPAFPRIDNLASVQAMDLLGNGTSCLVWMSSLPGDARRCPAQHALCRSDGRTEAAPAHIDQQQYGRGHQGPVCDLDQVLSAGSAGRSPVGDQAGLPGSCAIATVTTTASSASSAASPMSSSATRNPSSAISICRRS